MKKGGGHGMQRRVHRHVCVCVCVHVCACVQGEEQYLKRGQRPIGVVDAVQYYRGRPAWVQGPRGHHRHH